LLEKQRLAPPPTPVPDNRLDDWRNHFLFESAALPIIYILAMAGMAVALGGFFSGW
jgi:hypothetical protein